MHQRRVRPSQRERKQANVAVVMPYTTLQQCLCSAMSFARASVRADGRQVCKHNIASCRHVLSRRITTTIAARQR